MLAVAVAVLAALLAIPAASSAAPLPGVVRNWQPNGPINTVATSQDGSRAYIGGDFNYVGPDTGQSVRISPVDGAQYGMWPRFDGGAVHTIVPDGSGGWFVGGSFTHVDGILRRGLAHVRPSGQLDLTWTPANDLNGTVRALASDGVSLYVAGEFTQYQTITDARTRYLMRLDAATANLQAWSRGIDGIAPQVNDLVLDGSYVYAVGRFSGYDSSATAGIVRIDASTGLAANAGFIGTGVDSATTTVHEAELVGTTLYVAGTFSTVDGHSTSRVAALSTTGETQTFTSTLTSGSVTAIAWHPDTGKLHAASANGFVRFDTTGASSSWGAAPGMLVGDSVEALVVDGASIIAVGDFNAGTFENVVRLDAATGAATAIEVKVPARIRAATFAGTTLLLGGDFKSVNGVSRQYAAAIDLASGRATSWTPTVTGPVTAIVEHDGITYVGGGSTPAFLRRFDGITGAYMAWATPPTFSGTGAINDIVVLPNASPPRLLVGGSFDVKLVGYDLAGGAKLGSWLNTIGIVEDLEVASDGVHAYAAGSFSQLLGSSRQRLGRVHADGVVDNTFTPVVDGAVRAISLGPGSPPADLYLSGTFSNVNGTATTNLVSVPVATSTSPPSWSTSIAGTAYALRVGGGDAYVGGEVTNLAGTPVSKVGAVSASVANTSTWNPPPPIGLIGTVTDLAYTPNWVLVAGFGGLATYRLSSDSIPPKVEVVGIDEALATGNPDDATHVVGPNLVYVRTNGPVTDPKFTVRTTSFDQYSIAAGSYGDVSGLASVQWGSIPTERGVWTPDGSASPGALRGIRLDCIDAGAAMDGTVIGSAIDRAIDYDKVNNRPDRLPARPASLFWAVGKAYDDPLATPTDYASISCSWKGHLVTPQTVGTVSFRGLADNGMRMRLADGAGGMPGAWNVFDEWSIVGPTPQSAPFSIGQSAAREFVVEWWENNGDAEAVLQWDATGPMATVPEAAFVTNVGYAREYRLAGGPVLEGASSVTVGAVDHAGNDAFGSTFSVVVDNTPPTHGTISTAPAMGSFTAIARPTINLGPDSSDSGGSGVLDRTLQRRGTTLAAGTCATPASPHTDPGEWVDVVPSFTGTGPGSVTEPVDLPTGCYQYRYVVRDNVGNRAIFEPAGQADFTEWLKIDTTAPVTLAADIGYLDGWTTSDVVSVAFTAPEDPESGVAAGGVKLKSRVVSYDPVAGCDFSSATLTEVATDPDPLVPYLANVGDGTCVRFSIATTNRAGTETILDGGQTTLVDLTDPWGAFDSTWTMVPVPAVSGMPTITGWVDDGSTGSGAASARMTYRLAGDPEVDACTSVTLSGGSWSCDWNVSALADDTYTLTLHVTDVAGRTNTTTTTTQVAVDNTPPTMAPTFGDVAGQVWTESGTGTTWIRTTTGGSTSFATGADGTGSDISTVDFGTYPAGWNLPTPPAYPGWNAGTIAWDPGAATPTWSIDVHDVAGNMLLGQALPIVVDNTPPSAGSIDVPGVTQSTTSTAISVDPGTDVGAGIASASLKRRVGTLSGNACAWGAWSPFASINAAQSWTDSPLAGGNCYDYSLAVVDHVGNVRTYVDPLGDVVKVDDTTPTGTIDSHADGDWVRGTITVSGTINEPSTTVASVSVQRAGGDACTSIAFDNVSYTCEVDTTTVGDGPLGLTLMVTDAAGNTGSSSTRTLNVDNTAPAFEPTIADVAGTSFSSGATTFVRTAAAGPLAILTGANAAGGSPIASVTFAAPTWATTAPTGPTGWDDGSLSWSAGATTDATLTATITDVAGNTHAGTRSLVVDNSPPTLGSYTLDTSGSFPQLLEATATSDVGSGVAQYTLLRESTTLTGTTCDAGWAADAASTVTTWPHVDSASILPDRCYRYQVRAADRVGNQSATVSIAGEFQSFGPGLICTPACAPSGSMVEGDTASVQVRLRSAPDDTVELTFGASPAALATVSAPLTFTTSDWYVPQTMSVTIVDDQRDDVSPRSVAITMSSTSTDADYVAPTAVADTITVVDNDTPAVQFDVPAGGLAVAEPGTSASYRVRLATQPHGTVTITPAAGGQVALSGAATFSATGSDWSTWKTITVTAADDPDIEDAHAATVSHATSSSNATADAGYLGVPLATVPVAITDDDQAGLLLSPPSATTIDEAGTATSSFSVSLRARPVGTVTVSIASLLGQAAATPSTLTFEPGTWNVAQAVTVRATSDTVAEPTPHAARLQLAATSATSPAWAAAVTAPIELSITDDDPARLVASPGLRWVTDDENRVLLDETATQGSILRIRAVGDPRKDVKVTPLPAPDGQLVVSPASQVIPAGSHDQVVSFSVRAANDRVDEADIHAARIAWKVESADPLYAAATLPNTFARITDAPPPTTLRETTDDTSSGTGTSTGGGDTGTSTGGGDTTTSSPPPSSTPPPPADDTQADETAPAAEEETPGETVGYDGGIDGRTGDTAGDDPRGTSTPATEAADEPEVEGNVVTRPMRQMKQWASENKGKAAMAASAGGTAALWAAKPLALAGKALAAGGGGGLPAPPGLTQLRHLAKMRGGRQLLRPKRRRWWRGTLRDLRDDDDDDWDELLWGNDRAA